MMRIRDGEIAGFHAANSSDRLSDADYRIPAADIQQVEVSNRAQDLIDSTTFTLSNYKGRYNDTVRSGDRIELWLETEATSTSDARYGRARYGQLSASAGARREWVGFVHNTENESAGGGAGQYNLSVEAADFVYAVLASRRLNAAYDTVGISGGPASILNDALANEAPEIDRSQLGTFTETMSVKCNGMLLFDLLRRCLAEANAFAVASGTSLVFREPRAAAVQFQTDQFAGDYTNESYSRNDDGLINSLRVHGGPSAELDDDRSSYDHFTTVGTDPSSFVTTQIDTRKARLASAEIFTKRTGSEADLTVAVQADNGGSPEAPADSKSDIVNRSLSQEFLDQDPSDGDGTTFTFDSDHAIPGTSPWLIVRGGDGGQQVALDANNNLAYRTYFPYTTDVRVQDRPSIRKYRRRDGKITDEAIRSVDAAQSRGNALLAHKATPDESVTFDAKSRRTHLLREGNLFEMADDWLGAEGTYIVTKRDVTFEKSQLTASITAHTLDSLGGGE